MPGTGPGINDNGRGERTTDARKAMVAGGAGSRHEVTAGQQRIHPTQKPIALMKWTIKQADLQPGEIILDPYMGAGSTGIAAVSAGHPFIGIEIDEGYFDISCERIRKAYAQPDMFVAPRAPDPVQEALL